MRAEVYDLECLSNLFTYTGFDVQEQKYYQFVIHDDRNDAKALWEHLHRDKLLQIGFNNESYDYPLLHNFLNNYQYMYSRIGGVNIAISLYQKSQEIIDMEFSAIADKNKFIPQLDLFKIFHYDNKARMTSLKDIEFQLRMDDIEEMPIHHATWCTKDDIDTILSYNKNDVEATYKFFLVALGKTDDPIYKGKNKIALRCEIQRQFGINCLNYPDVKIGERLILKLYSEKTHKSLYDLKQSGGTIRETIQLKDCIPYWANFETKEFNELKQKLIDATISSIKGEFEASVVFHNTKMDYGTGGCHSCIKPGIYNADDKWMIVDEDIGSLYPSIAIQLGIYPEHLGPEFLDIYNNKIVARRLAEKKKPKAERDNVIMEGFKLAANGVYGKTGEENSVLYDPLYTMKTTIGGQMFLSLWTEKLVKAVPELKFLQHNTDGITYMIPKDKLDKVKAVGEEMTKLTGLYIEDNYYKTMILRDVNNYIAVYEDSTQEHEHVKLKGCFEIDKEYHKDSSMRIVPIALKNYFLYDIPVGDTIRNHTDIFDFCLRLKTNSKSQAVYSYYDNGETQIKKLSRTTRYYVSNNGGGLIKDFGSGRLNGVNVGFHVTLFNKFEAKDMKDYDINYGFYISEANKIIYTIVDKQMSFNFF